MMMIEQVYIMHDKSSVTEEEGMGTFHWVIWLLDRLSSTTNRRIQTAPQPERLASRSRFVFNLGDGFAFDFSHQDRFFNLVFGLQANSITADPATPISMSRR